MAELATIARPYAEALFDALGSTLQPHAGEPGNVADQLDALASVVADPTVKQFADDPKAQPAQVDAVLQDVLGKLGVTPSLPVRNLIGALVDNGRLPAVGAIASQFRERVNAARGFSDAVIESAFPMDDAQVTDLLATLERRFGRKLVPHVQVSPELIGGVRVIVGDEVLDTSVKARLEQMKVALTA